MGIQARVAFILHIAGSPGSVSTRGINEPHRKLVEIVQCAADDFTGSKRYGDFGLYMFGIQHPLLEFEALITGCNIGTISRWRRAGRAPPRSVEILLARLNIAGLEIGCVNAFASTYFRVSGITLLGMDKGHQAGHLIVGKIEARHALVRTAISQPRADLVPARILSHQPGTREIRSTLAAARIAAVTKRTITPEKSAPALNQSWWILCGRRCAFIVRDRNRWSVSWRLRCGDDKAHEQKSRQLRCPMQS